jgi:hypothetical protein
MIAALTLAVAVSVSSSADTVVTVLPESRLWIRGLQGQITVETWTKSAVRLRSQGPRGEKVRIARRGPTVTIDSKRTGRRSQYTVTVPSWMSVALVSPDASARVSGMKGGLMVRTVNGAVDVEDNEGPIYLSSVQGPIRVSRAKGRLEVNTVNGPINLDAIAGWVNAETVNGPIELARMLGDSIEATTVNGPVTFDGSMRQGGWYRFATHHGDIEVVLPTRPDARVSVSTYGGEFESEVPVPSPRSHQRKRLQFTLGDGKSWLQLESFLGRIRLSKATPGARRAPPPAFEWPDRVSSASDEDQDEEDKE